MAFSGARFGEGIGRIWLNNVQCTGSERALMNCATNSSGVDSCTHAQDAGIRCREGENTHFSTITDTDCSYWGEPE